MDGMNEVAKYEKIQALRLDFDKKLMELQNLLVEIHKHGGKDVIHYRENGTEAEIFREYRD